MCQRIIRWIFLISLTEKESDMRKNLKEARQKAGMTQREVAEKLGIQERYYRFLESGARDGNFKMWDTLEDLFGVHQRILRELSSD